MIDQLMRMDVEKVVRISKDAIVYERHSFELQGYMEHKELPSLDNEPAQCYCTNVWRAETEGDLPCWSRLVSGHSTLGHSEGQKGREEGREHRKEISRYEVKGHPGPDTPRIPDTCHTFTLRQPRRPLAREARQLRADTPS